VTVMLVTGSSYVALASIAGSFPQSSVAATTTVFSTLGSRDGFPRSSSGGWPLNYFGDDPTPEGCKNLVNTTFKEGHSLKTFVSSNAVKAGGLVCIDVVLQNVNGTVVTWGHSDELLTGYKATDSTGRVFQSINCIPSVPPPGMGPGADVPRPVAGCASVWETSLSDETGVAPHPGHTESLLPRLIQE